MVLDINLFHASFDAFCVSRRYHVQLNPLVKSCSLGLHSDCNLFICIQIRKENNVFLANVMFLIFVFSYDFLKFKCEYKRNHSNELKIKVDYRKYL